MRYIVIQSHKSNYPNPICLNQGEKVRIDHVYEGEEEWENWVFCYSEGEKGWVPKQIIEYGTENIGTILEAYTARELDIEIGEILIAIRELNGWMWCEKVKNEEQGWVPKRAIRKMHENDCEREKMI